MSTEHSLLKIEGDKNDLSSINLELSLTESGSRYTLNAFKTHPTIQEAFEHDVLVKNLTPEQLEHLAVRLLYIAWMTSSTKGEDLLTKYNLPLHDDRNVPLEL